MKLEFNFNFQKPKDFHMTREKMKQVIGHFTIWMMGIILLAVFHNMAITPFHAFFVLGYFIWTIGLAISLADYLDIIKFRKAESRFTQCSICGRTSEAESFEKYTKKIETKVKGKNPDGDRFKETTTQSENLKDKVPAVPFNGIIIFDKTICTECISNINKIKSLMQK